MKLSIAALVSVSIIASPALAEDRLYGKTAPGWEIWQEGKSCAMYREFHTGTLLRVSDRTDENQLYIWAENDKWLHLKSKAGEVLGLYVNFPAELFRHAIAGVVVPSPVWGYSGAGLQREAVLGSLAKENPMILEGKFGTDKLFEIEKFELDGSQEAVTKLIQCSHDHFGAPVFSAGRGIEDTPALNRAPEDIFVKHRSVLERWKACVVKSARKFATSRETAPVVATSAVANCYSVRNEVAAAFVLDGTSKSRLPGLERGLISRAELEVVKARSK